MKFQKTTIGFLALAAVTFVLGSCGGGSVSIGDLPAYPGAVELKAGDSQLAATLARNTEQDAALRKAMGAGGQVVQRGFDLPADTTWNKVKDYYEKELKSRGWQSGLGGLAGGMVDINSMMSAASQDENAPKTMVFSRGNQTLSLIMTASPSKPGQKTLILSLSTR